MSSTLPSEAAKANSYPTTASGKRNWSWTAVHGQVARPSAQTLPNVEGGFGTLLDIINPLQHIPVVSNVYRAATGDSLSSAGRIIGGGLFGGPIGLLAGIGGSIVAETTGRDVGEHLLAALGGKGGAAGSTTSSGTNTAEAAGRYASALKL